MSIRSSLLLAAGCFALAMPALAGSGTSLFINEVDCDQIGTDAAEFIELYSPSGAQSLDNYFVVLYNGNAPADNEYLTFDLDGQSVPADGFFVIGPQTGTVPNTDYSPSNFPDTNAIQNGFDAVALYYDPTGLVVAGDFFNMPAATPPAGVTLVDALVYDTSDADDVALIALLTPGQPQIDENGNGSGIFESCQRFPDGGTGLVTSTYVVKTPTPGIANVWNPLGNALAGTAGEPVLTGTGTLTAGSSGTLELDNANASATAYLVVGLTQLNGNFKGGVLVPNPDLLVILVTSGTGEVDLGWNPWVTGLPSGTNLYFQYWVTDAGGPKGYAASNALQVTQP